MVFKRMRELVVPAVECVGRFATVTNERAIAFGYTDGSGPDTWERTA
jgi:hypothetical protein